MFVQTEQHCLCFNRINLAVKKALFLRIVSQAKNPKFLRMKITYSKDKPCCSRTPTPFGLIWTSATLNSLHILHMSVDLNTRMAPCISKMNTTIEAFCCGGHRKHSCAVTGSLNNVEQHRKMVWKNLLVKVCLCFTFTVKSKSYSHPDALILAQKRF